MNYIKNFLKVIGEKGYVNVPNPWTPNSKFSLEMKENDQFKIINHFSDRPLYTHEIEDASFDAARAERVWSVEDIDIVKSKCEEDTIEVVTMSDKERLRFKEATEYMYEKYDDNEA